MPDKSFKVNIYDVASEHSGDDPPTQFYKAIESASGQPLAIREKNISGKGRRLDGSEQRTTIFLLNFITFEYSGPGRVRKGQPTKTIPLGPDESFAPETAMLYDSANNLAFIESSLGSMGTGSIVRYFEEFAHKGTSYSMHPRPDADAAARARRQQTIRNLKMRISLGPITDFDRTAGIDPIKAFGADYGAGYIDVEIKSERARGRSLIPQNIQRLIDHLMGSDMASPHITQLQVTGREHDEDPLEVIDLIQQRERRQLVLEIDGATRKIPHRVRWDTLINIQQAFTQG